MNTTTYWIFNVVFVALWMLAFAFTIIGGWRYGRRHGYAEIKQEYSVLQVEHGVMVAKADGFEQELERAIKERDQFEYDRLLYIEKATTLNEQNIQLEAINADLLDALQDARAEIKALEMRTVEMPEIAAPSNIPARPTMPQPGRKKAGGD